MNNKNVLVKIFAIYIAMSGVCSAAPQTSDQSANGACASISEKCTMDKPYDKTISGKSYSCYDCKQALCKDGGKGGLAGTKTSSVCTEKASTFEPVSQDDLFRGKANATITPTENAPTDPVVNDHRSPKIDSNSNELAEIVAPNNRTGTVQVKRTRPSTSSTENAPDPNVQRSPKEWELGRGSGKQSRLNGYDTYLKSGWYPHKNQTNNKRGINLFNLTNGQALVYERRGTVLDSVPLLNDIGTLSDVGVSLGWMSRSEVQTNRKRQPFTFHREGSAYTRGGDDSIRYGEPIAIYFGRTTSKSGNGFLIYQKRARGINLAIQERASHEWKITGGKEGTPIRHQGRPGQSMRVGIYNTNQKDYMVYCKRKWGVNLGWAKDCNGGLSIVDHRKGTSTTHTAPNVDHREGASTTRTGGAITPTENAPTDPVVNDHRSPKIDSNSNEPAEIVAPNNRTGTVRVKRTLPSTSSTENAPDPIVTDHRK